MSPATPTAGTETAGSGSTWFKIWEAAPVYEGSSVLYVFPSQTASTITFTIPNDTPSGDYLIRVEQIALHAASAFGGAQFYLGCAQVTVTGGGSGVPGPLVSFPGAYTGNEPGIKINIYTSNPDGAYIAPGPPVWTGGVYSGGSGGTTTAKISSSTSKATTSTSGKPTSTSTTVKTTTTSTGPGSAPLYGQCGGQGWTGPTTCASGTCTYSNTYYSQCL